MSNNLKRPVLRPWSNFVLLHKRKRPGQVLPPAWATEDTREVEQLRQAERRITAATGWNSSTLVIGQVLHRLRGDSSAS